jgi:hypothetical protein
MLNHGGLIWVQSPNPGSSKGATFYFTMMSAQDRCEQSDHDEDQAENLVVPGDDSQ